MFTARFFTRAIAVAAGLSALAACSGEDLLENAIENRIEAESGEDVEIDFDDGNITIESEDGTVEFTTDDDGTVTVEGVDDDGGEFSVNSDDGTTTIQTDDGTAVMTEGGDVPDCFPSELALPDDFEVLFTQVVDTPEESGCMLVGQAPGDFASYADELVASLEAAGYDQQSLTTSPQGTILGYDNGERSVFGQIAAESGDGDGVSINILIGPSEGS